MLILPTGKVQRMLLSLDENWIFLKPKKAAGTTIEGALRLATGNIDIGTPMVEVEEREVLALGAHVVTNQPMPARAWEFQDFKRFIKSGFRAPYFRYHQPALQMKNFVGNEHWQKLIKISSTRDPFDRLISLFYWRNKRRRPDVGTLEITEQRELFARFVRGKIDSELRLIRSTTHIKGICQIDRWIRFENLDNDLSDLVQDLFGARPRFVENYRKIRLKEGVRPPNSDASKLFFNNPKLIALVRRKFSWEFDYLGYPETPGEK